MPRVMLLFRSSTVLELFAETRDYTQSHKKISKGVKSHDIEGHNNKFEKNATKPSTRNENYFYIVDVDI